MIPVIPKSAEMTSTQNTLADIPAYIHIKNIKSKFRIKIDQILFCFCNVLVFISAIVPRGSISNSSGSVVNQPAHMTYKSIKNSKTVLSRYNC